MTSFLTHVAWFRIETKGNSTHVINSSTYAANIVGLDLELGEAARLVLAPVPVVADPKVGEEIIVG